VISETQLHISYQKKKPGKISQINPFTSSKRDELLSLVLRPSSV